MKCSRWIHRYTSFPVSDLDNCVNFSWKVVSWCLFSVILWLAQHILLLTTNLKLHLTPKKTKQKNIHNCQSSSRIQTKTSNVLLLKLVNINSPATSQVESSQIISFIFLLRWIPQNQGASQRIVLVMPRIHQVNVMFSASSMVCSTVPSECFSAFLSAHVPVGIPVPFESFWCWASEQSSTFLNCVSPPSNTPLPSPLISDCWGLQATHGSGCYRRLFFIQKYLQTADTYTFLRCSWTMFSALKSSLKTAKRPQLNQTKTVRD